MYPPFTLLGLDARVPWQTSLGKAVISSFTQLGSFGKLPVMYLYLNIGHGAGGLQDVGDKIHLGKSVPRAPVDYIRSLKMCHNNEW